MSGRITSCLVRRLGLAIASLGLAAGHAGTAAPAAAAAPASPAAPATTPVSSTPPGPAAFRSADGSYTVTVGGPLSDPYFVNKALIIALQSGLNVRTELNAWLQWLLPRQRADGGFDRYCRNAQGAWRACMPADADDAMAATTIHLVALAERSGQLAGPVAPAARAASAKARSLLNKLLDPANGLYRVFANRAVFYLMDNAEVYDALRAAGDAAAAQRLRQAMRRHFVQADGQWQPAIPAYDKASFYPHTLAHSYLWQGGIADKSSAAGNLAAWLSHHSRAWLSRSDDSFAWGLVAWNIAKLAPAEAGCWRQSVRPLPQGVGWTVLDAFIDQALQHRGIAAACARQL